MALAGLLCLAAASDPAERLSDPAKEARARILFREIRCVVCQSESIDDSEAALAHDIRQVVREQVSEGRTNSQIKQYLVARYGEFVLLKPSFSWTNAALWLTPILAALCGGVAIVIYVGKPRSETEAPLSAEEEAEVRKLLVRHAFASRPPQENTEDELSVS
jgi:cytochrome c-type biogenesis protein CcmH